MLVADAVSVACARYFEMVNDKAVFSDKIDNCFVNLLSQNLEIEQFY